MAELTTEGGKLVAEICDFRGEIFGYRVKRLKGLPVRYELLKDGAESPYLVTFTAQGWACTCPAWEFRNARNRVTHPHTCKHCVACAEKIHPVVEAILSGVES